MKIDMTEVNDNKTTLTTSIDNLNSQLETAKTSFTNLVNTDSLQGEVKTAIDGKINNYQIPLLTNFSNSLSTLSAQYDKAIEAFQTTVEETSATAIIDTDYLQGLEDGYSTIESSIATIDSETSKIYSSISDIISLSNPSSSDITTPLSEAKKVLTDTKSNMETFNGWTQGTEFSELLASQGTILASLSELIGVSYTDADASAFYSDASFADGVKTIAQGITSAATPVALLNSVSKALRSAEQEEDSWWQGFAEIWKEYTSAISGSSLYKGVTGSVSLLQTYLKIFIKGSKTRDAADLGGKAFQKLSLSWSAISKSGKDLRSIVKNLKNSKAWGALAKIGKTKGWKSLSKTYKWGKKYFDAVKNPLKSFVNNLSDGAAKIGKWGSKLKSKTLSLGLGLVGKIANSKAWKKVTNSKAWNKVANSKAWKNVSGVPSKLKGPLKSGIKTLGKVARVGGWAMTIAEAGISGYQAYNDKDSRAYHSVGKSAIHAGVETVKNAGPIEYTLAGAEIGSVIPGVGTAVGAGVGFVVGSANAMWGVVDGWLGTDSKERAYSWVENKLDDAYDWTADKVQKAGKAVGDTMSRGWNNVKSAFGF
ncbi:T7SS effector LXG polymorphic toxin [Streptococcus pantholopis]|uniref:LXG domain-containing protein n=1 Tax=Streptococcus pantholopis TaxID=1811193 RepID=A0A172Q533_9STRE|nr:T7SS effector LXG polymorphic toxin [Streptococcus pantholopis]AND78532.1 hypothetical protein A0O21_00105 [Streptococcus pantholopis]